ncbi:hypothetical protein EYC84_008627 [Monilinia fructicola]|uniref:(S)-ureidoglycine aminohydrolase cupin domain-containing protein n=1 Tax=Monilinia fructicola TaxID=38448 RepID=A0A5M9JHN0_MONFR|nr:hypothetical protein EYC84_008627 [Monilinia fructicola]
MSGTRIRNHPLQIRESVLFKNHAHGCKEIRFKQIKIIQFIIINKTIEKMSLPFTYHANAQTEFKPPLIANENAFLGDVSVSTDEAAPLSADEDHCGWRVFDISDETGQKVHATKGDVFYFPKGSKITFTTETFGLGFFVGQRKTGTA